MSKTVLIELPMACANQVRVVLEKAQREDMTYHNMENAEDNYKRGLSYAYLECAIVLIKEAMEDER